MSFCYEFIGRESNTIQQRPFHLVILFANKHINYKYAPIAISKPNSQYSLADIHSPMLLLKVSIYDPRDKMQIETSKQSKIESLYLESSEPLLKVILDPSAKQKGLHEEYHMLHMQQSVCSTQIATHQQQVRQLQHNEVYNRHSGPDQRVYINVDLPNWS